MCAPKIAAPEAPDYAAANREAVQADIDTLPLRKQIEAQARLGLGQFAGMGDVDQAAALQKFQLESAPEYAAALLKLQQDYGKDFAQSARDQLAVTDPTGFALRDAFGGRLSRGEGSLESLLDGAKTFDSASYLAKYPDLARAVEGMTPEDAAKWAENHYNQHGRFEGREAGYRGGDSVPTYELAGGAPDYLKAAIGERPSYMEGANAPVFGDADSTRALRGLQERDAYDQLSQVGNIDPALRRYAEQSARARGAASGNILGDSSALNEALTVQLAGLNQDQQRRGNALSFLTSGQTTSDADNANRLANFNAEQSSRTLTNQARSAGENDLMNRINQSNSASSQAFNDAMAAINQRNQAKQNQFSADQGATQQKIGARQQDMANIQSFLGLQPIVSQGGQLSGLQQGAAPFQMTQVQQGLGINQNAGAQGTQFAGNVFGTQAGIYNTQLQNSGSPFGKLIGNVLGGVGSSVGSALGGSVGKLFNF